MAVGKAAGCVDCAIAGGALPSVATPTADDRWRRDGEAPERDWRIDIVYERRLATAAAGLVLMLAVAGCAAFRAPPTLSASPDNARTSLDWAGTCHGVLPCADCAGIATTVTLAADGSYRAELRYLGKAEGSFRSAGHSRWNAAGSTVTLGGGDPARYFVAENRLIRLAQDGTRITGPLAPRYVLTKVP